MNNKIKVSKKDLIIKIILIIVIIVLLIHNCCLLNSKRKRMTPTNNTNVIEIICNKEDTCVIDDKKVNRENNYSTYSDKVKKTNDLDSINSNDGNNNNTNNKSNNDNSGDSKETELLIDDGSIRWENTTPAKIFTNSMYELDDKIAPESSNTYQFIVKNKTNYNINYLINFRETNPYNINMKYKLKKNNTYLIDHYVSASELNQTNLTLNSKNNDIYYLEWKWISSDNDTQIGEASNAKYELKIEVKAESKND